MAQFARTQPQGLARINRSNPLTRGLYGLFSPGQGGSGAILDPACGAVWTPDAAFPFAYGKNGRGALTNGASKRYYASLPQYPGTVNGGANYAPGAVVLVVRVNATSGTEVFVNNVGAWLGISGGQWSYNGGGNSANTTAALGRDQVVIFNVNLANVGTIWVDGVASTATFAPNGFIAANPVSLLEYGTGGFSPANSALYQFAIFNRELTQAEVKSLTANPWQLFDAPSQTQFPRAAAAGGTGAALSGAASALASATGSLTTSIPLSASAAAVASASGALSTQIALSGAAAGQATASGALTTQIRLTGSAGAVAAASGALSTQIALAGAAAGAASASGALSTQIALAGTASASSSASGALTAGTGLSGSASASSSASGALATSIALAGSASCTSSASGALSTMPVGAALSGSASATSSALGSLTTAIVLAGAAIAQASASGSLAGQAAALSGSAVCSSSAAGSLSTQIVVAGAAQAVASAVGSLTTAIRLAGAATCSSSAAGALSTGLLPPEPNPHRMIVVPRRKRHFVARHRVRHFEVGR